MRKMSSVLDWIRLPWINVLFFSLVAIRSQGMEPESVCQTEQMDARCRSNEVIMMTSALYGRMRSGRCVDRNYGYVGCNASVLAQADSICSGRRQCSIAVPNAVFESVTVANECPKDLKLYLEATFQCLPVVTANEKLCPLRSNVLPLTQSPGFISNIYTEETELGSVKCPWLIQAGKRQRINITLLDFATAGVTSSGPGDPCHAYAIVRDRQASKVVTVCSGPERERHILLSENDEVEVRMQTSLNRNRTKHFLLRYEFVGCAEPELNNRNEFVVQWSPGRMEIGCKTNNRRWTLICSGTKWSGEFGNCSDLGSSDQFFDMISAKSSIPWGASVVAVSVIALTLAIIILAAGLMILRCHRRAQPTESLPNDVYYGETVKRDADIRVPASVEYRTESIHRCNLENEYSYIGDVMESGSGPGGVRRSYDYGTTDVRNDGPNQPFESSCSAGEVEKRNVFRPSAYFELEPNSGPPQKRLQVGSDPYSGFDPMTRCCRQTNNDPAAFADVIDRRCNASADGASKPGSVATVYFNDDSKHQSDNYKSV